MSRLPGWLSLAMAAMRISVSNWTTSRDDVERSIEAIMRATAERNGLPVRR